MPLTMAKAGETAAIRKISGKDEVVIQDMPGIYSLSPCTLVEVAARSYLVNETPDAILNIVDAPTSKGVFYLLCPRLTGAKDPAKTKRALLKIVLNRAFFYVRSGERRSR